ncbi:MAG: hypothetical protein JWQ34_2104 [Mucilaginibacter sp.]|uniref:phage/plasmid replication domain-containing protein n=1 Tax=Mucilaginibacter sp. TaxID=1882438 RepID=UPI002616114C|nr:phage/plasmid replication protein [Mucilaginibacter sp.]MDB5003879.1 hypothetical protein [Mucilaginibacter sp.]
MYDTFNFTLPHTFFDYDHIRHIFDTKLAFKVDKRYLNGSAIVANYENYAFSLSKKHLRANGSLTKLYYGNNVQNLNYTQIQDALMQFETLFEIPFDDAIVSRIDVATSINLSNPVNMYLDLLVAPSGYKASNLKNETKRYEKGNDTLNFYNKVADMRIKDTLSYKIYKADFILKYERRCTKNLLDIIDTSDLKFKNFYTSEVYKNLIEYWYNGYQSVLKLTNPQPTQLKYNSLTDFKQSLINEGIKSLNGVEVLSESINQIKINKKVRYRINEYLYSLPKLAPLSPILQRELDNKIQGIYNNEMAYLEELN